MCGWCGITVEHAASAALGCPPWELGLCAGCGQMMRRYGLNAAMYCNVCRSVLNGRQLELQPHTSKAPAASCGGLRRIAR
ncbi:hypothetical protein EAO73_32805 [Streptomyces sp. col6]|nr:hypothetical protein EAO73_32805 [Streptomyces sp. col6]